MTLSCLFALLTIEGAVRIRHYVKYGSTKNTLYSTTFDTASGLVIPIPSQKTRTTQTNSMGFRSPELPAAKSNSTIRLAFLGASTTFCAEASSNEATWPHLVWKSLQETYPDVQFDYVNGGVPGYSLENSLRNLTCRIAPLEPDVIIIYHAVNDLSRDSREFAERKGLYRGSVDKPGLLGRWLLTWFLIEKNLQIWARQHRAMEGSKGLVLNPQTLSRGFHTRLQELVLAAQRFAPVVAVATFSQRLRRHQSPEEQIRASNTHLYYMPHMRIEALLSAFEEYNRVICQVAAETEAILIGGEETIPGDNRFFNDSVHFNDAGCELMARRITKALLASQDLQRLLHRGNSARTFLMEITPFKAGESAQRLAPKPPHFVAP